MKLLLWRLLVVLGLCPFGGVFAQYWAPLDSAHPTYPGEVEALYADTVKDVLVVGGGFKWITNGSDSLDVHGLAIWDGTHWDTLASTIQSCPNWSCTSISRLARYQGKLYANGEFDFPVQGGAENHGFARWNEDSLKWEGLECTNPVTGGASTLNLDPPYDTIYITGSTNQLCGYEGTCVFTYDGSTFQRFVPFDQITYNPLNRVDRVFEFQGDIYLTGLLFDPATGQYSTFIRYNGASWEPVPGWEPQNWYTQDAITSIVIHDNKLYVAGYFYTFMGAPGNLVAMFDGSTWSDLGGGLKCADGDAIDWAVYDMLEWNGDIYVAGRFFCAGGVDAFDVARWNGHQWCGLGEAYTNLGMADDHARRLAVWRDTLYMSVRYLPPVGIYVNKIVKWLGQVENCSTPVGISEHDAEQREIQTSLVDPDGIWSLVLPKEAQWTLQLYDMHGHVVQAPRSTSPGQARIDLRSYSAGMYVVRCIDQEGRAWSTKLLKP